MLASENGHHVTEKEFMRQIPVSQLMKEKPTKQVVSNKCTENNCASIFDISCMVHRLFMNNYGMHVLKTMWKKLTVFYLLEQTQIGKT